MTRKPTFINIGPGRCATSWLFDVLTRHPDVAMAAVKETEYFNTNYDQGPGWYERHFPTGNQTACGEISNNYYLDPEVANRIAAYDRSIKIMINVRRPVDLLRSYYQFGLRRGVEMVDGTSFLDQPIGPIMGSGYDYRLRRNALTTCDKRTLLESVCLADRFLPYVERFSGDRIYILVYERFVRDRDRVLSEIYDFIGVDSKFRPEMADSVVNPALAPRSRLVAKVATRTSFMLRRMGLYGVLNSLKESKFVKGLLYSQQRALNGQTGWFDSLPSQIRVQLREQEDRLMELLPAIQPWWKALDKETPKPQVN